jgi:hypothetical protein
LVRKVHPLDYPRFVNASTGSKSPALTMDPRIAMFMMQVRMREQMQLEMQMRMQMEVRMRQNMTEE